MLQRTEAHRGEIEGMMAIVHRGDDLDPVVSCVGNAEDLSADSQGNVNLIEAAKAAGAQRFVLVSGSPESPLGEAQLAAKGEAAALVCRALFSDRAAGKTVTAVAADALG